MTLVSARELDSAASVAGTGAQAARMLRLFALQDAGAAS